jgi:hypothetical protein
LVRRPHLTLRRLEGQLERRKKPGFGTAPQRNHVLHGGQLGVQLAQIVERNAMRNAERVDEPVADPTVILKITTDGYLGEDALTGVGLQILEQRSDDVTVALSVDPSLAVLRERSHQYAGPIPITQAGARHASFFGVIDSFDELSANDKIGSALARHGFSTLEMIPDDDVFLIDVELWDANEDLLRDLYIDRVARKADAFGGELLSRYRGAGLFIARVRVPGAGLKELLAMTEVAWIDLPAVPDFAPEPGATITTTELPPIIPPPANAVCIGIVDSGITAAHPMLDGVIAGAFGVPAELGSDDEKRHGTSVAALASYGSIAEHISENILSPRFRVASAKIVDGNGRFDEERTVADIVEEAIRRLNAEYGCRVINISLADIEHIVGGRPSNWAMTLDNLVRELGIVITVSAGNILSISHRIADEGVGIYPEYLLEDEHRLYEPASSMNSLVVGSLAHSNGLMPGEELDADIVALTATHHPSPFSRSGPGFAKSIKPDLVEYGGTAVWLGFSSSLSADRDSCGVLTLNPNYLQSLMVYRHGTSFAAPVAAYKAAALVEEFPDASANFVRALMGLSTDHPVELIERVTSDGGREHFRYAGYGVANISLAEASEDNRVVMAIEDNLPIDRFAVYEVPIPTDFQTVKGVRHIKVSLAFDPPVRNSRKEYLGVKMGYHLVRENRRKRFLTGFGNGKLKKKKRMAVPQFSQTAQRSAK